MGGEEIECGAVCVSLRVCVCVPFLAPRPTGAQREGGSRPRRARQQRGAEGGEEGRQRALNLAPLFHPLSSVIIISLPHLDGPPVLALPADGGQVALQDQDVHALFQEADREDEA